MPRSADSRKVRVPGTLDAGELRGSTFTVTSAGKLAGLFQTPIVNHPEVAILSIGRIAESPSSARARSSRVAPEPSRSLLITASSTARGRPSSGCW